MPLADADFGLPGYDAWKLQGPPEDDPEDDDEEARADAEAFAYHLREENDLR